MQSFILGTVIDPILVSSDYGNILKFGLLSGRTCKEFSVFEYSVNAKTGERFKNNLYDNASSLKNGDFVACIIFTSVSKSGKLGVYLRDVSLVDRDVQTILNEAFTRS